MDTGKGKIMRFGFAALILYAVAMNSAQAEMFRIATADTVETRAIAKLIEKAYRRLGHETEIVFRPAGRSVWDVNKGIFDAELARITGIENEFPNLVRVKEPVFTISVSAVVLPGSDIKVRSWEDIGDRRVGYPRGYKLFDLRTRKLNAIKAKDPASIVKMVKAGRMDIGLLMMSDATALSQKLGGVTVLEPPIEVTTLYHYVHVKHRRMVPSLEKTLITMNDSGRSKEILSGHK